jgi:hypothetical protein
MRSISSNVPLARVCIQFVLRECDIDDTARRYCNKALSLMTRASAVRRAPATVHRITAAEKRAVMALKHSDLTMHEIANQVGLANGGRVSEIMGRKR